MKVFVVVALISCMLALPGAKAAENEAELAAIGRNVVSLGGTFVDLLAQIAQPVADMVAWVGKNAASVSDMLIKAVSALSSWAGGFAGDAALGKSVSDRVVKLGNLLVKEGIPALNEGAQLIKKGATKLQSEAKRLAGELGVTYKTLDLGSLKG